MTTITLYVHLIPQTSPLISETLKVALPADTAIFNDLRLRVLD